MYSLCYVHYVNLYVGPSRVGLHGTDLFDCTSTFEIVDSIPVPSMKVSVHCCGVCAVCAVCSVGYADFLAHLFRCRSYSRLTVQYTVRFGNAPRYRVRLLPYENRGNII